MKFFYEIIETGLNASVILRSNGAYIPKDEANSDYQRYLRWLENSDADENGTL